MSDFQPQITQNVTINGIKDAVMEKLRNVSGSVLLYGFYIIIIACAIIYYIRITRLPAKQCDLFNEFYSKSNGNISNLVAGDEDLLRSFYIKTAYNCCSGGDYKNDYVSTCTLKNILLQGVRALDFEIYSLDDQPVVSTSTSDSYHIKETFNSINFSEVMQILDNNAFIYEGGCPNPNDPLIVHLRIKSSNNKMFKNLLKIFKNTQHILGKDYSYVSHGNNLGDMPVNKFKNKIIVIVDSMNAAVLDTNSDLTEYINMTSSSTYMRLLNYDEEKYPADIEELISYNSSVGMTFVMPDKGNDPANPSRILCHDNGSQMVAMRYQLFDANLEENESFFNTHRSAFVPSGKTTKTKNISVTLPSAKEKKLLSYAPRNVDLGFVNFVI